LKPRREEAMNLITSISGELSFEAVGRSI
jgi:hypothetical protein